MARNNFTYVILNKSEIVDGSGNELINATPVTVILAFED